MSNCVCYFREEKKSSKPRLLTALITGNSLNQLFKNTNHNLRVLKDNCNLHTWNILLLQLSLEMPFTCSTGGWPPGNLCPVLLTTLGQHHAHSLMSRPTKWQSCNVWLLVFPLLQDCALTLSKPVALLGWTSINLFCRQVSHNCVLGLLYYH